MRRYQTSAAVARRLTYLALRRLALEDEAEKLKHEEVELARAHIGLFLEKGVAQEKVNGIGTVTLAKQPIVTIEDWDACLAWAAAHPKYGIVHKRVSATAVEKFAFEGGVVPGLVLNHHHILTVNVREGRKKT